MNLSQLQTMLWLRWRLTRNQWRRGGNVGAVIAAFVSAVLLMAGAAGGFFGLAAGFLWLGDVKPLAMMVLWDVLVLVFLFFWTMGIVAELQRSELVDAGRLLHLPVSLADVFLLNYLSSHLSLSLALVLPAMLGLAAGLVLGHGVAMLLLFPLIVCFFFMITAWTYCLRGWLAALMINPRRRRAVIVGVTMTFVLIVQLPNLLTNVWMRGGHNGSRPRQETVRTENSTMSVSATIVQAHAYVPFLWLPGGARSLVDGNAWPAVWGTLGMLVLGAWGLARAYRLTLRFYQGGETNRPSSGAAPPTRAVSVAAPAGTGASVAKAAKQLLVERTFPGVPEDAAAMAFASLRSMLRAPEIKMAMVTNLVVFVIFGGGMLFRSSGQLPEKALPFLADGAVVVGFLGMIQIMSNHFGFDRTGFRSLVLLPTPRRNILLGKNLSLLPVALGVVAILLGLATVLAHLGLAALLTGVFGFCTAFALFSTLGNLASIMAPYRIAAGSVRASKRSSTRTLVIMATHMVMQFSILPIFVPPALGLLCDQFHWLPGGPVTLASAALLAAASGWIYWKALGPLGRLLERRERNILQVVTQEVE